MNLYNQPILDTHEQIIFNRRRYGRTTYTWATLIIDGDKTFSLGDPWPGINWPKKVLTAEIARLKSENGIA